MKKNLKNLLTHLLVNEPSERLTIQGVIAHPFFTGEIQCDFWKRCLAITGSRINFDKDIDRNEKFDKCFCRDCLDGTVKKKIIKNKQEYTIPEGFARIGVQPAKTKGAVRDLIEKWHMSLIMEQNMHSLNEDILKSGQLLALGSTRLSGDKIQVRPGHMNEEISRKNKHTNRMERFDPTDKIFLSPSAKYCEYKDIYMDYMPVDGASYGFALEVLIQPGTYKIGQETVGTSKKKNRPIYFK